MNAIERTFGFINAHPLASRHLMSAYLKFIGWQIKTLTNKNLIEMRFVNPAKFFAKKGLTGITGNIYTGLHEFEDMGFLLHFLRPEDIFFDVGANVGSYTLLASSVCGAKSVSFEPIASTFEILSKNITLNQLSSLVTLHNKGVGSKNDILKFTTNNDTTNHIVESSDEGLEIEVVALNNLISGGFPTLIKIDVEGFETEVLKGASKVLENDTCKAIIIELNGSGGRYGYDENEIHNLFIKHSFKPYSYSPLNRNLTQLSTFGSFNTIYIRDPKFVADRLRTATPFSVFNENI